MREIKFRAWDKKNKEMINDIQIFPEYSWLVQSDNDPLCERERPEEGQIILMQFTNLLDSEGNEIYEGDIVEIKELAGKIIHEVEWNMKGVWTITLMLMSAYHKLNRETECKIIGNIYEKIKNKKN